MSSANTGSSVGYPTEQDGKVAPTFGSIQARFIPKEADYYYSEDDLVELFKRYVDRQHRYLLLGNPDGDPYDRASYPSRIPRMLECALEHLAMLLSSHSSAVVPWEHLRSFEGLRLERALNSTVCLINSRGDMIEIPNRSRGSPAYRRRMRNLSGNLEDFIIDNNLDCILLTLGARCPLGMSPVVHDDLFDGLINSLISYIRFLVGHEVMYLWGKEPTPTRGYTHIHLLLVGVSYVSVERLANWWVSRGYGEGQGVDLKRFSCDGIRQNRGRSNPAFYPLKEVIGYPFKGHSDLAWGGLQTLKRSRLWTISNTLRKALTLYLEETKESSSSVGLVSSTTLTPSDEWAFYGVNRHYAPSAWEIPFYFPGRPPPPEAT